MHGCPFLKTLFGLLDYIPAHFNSNRALFYKNALKIDTYFLIGVR
jgi:hypothetical protein